MLKTINQIHFIYINMRIPIFLITNIIWSIGINKSKAKPEETTVIQQENRQFNEQYISVDISAHSPTNNFYFLNSQINGVDTVIIFPNSQNKIEEIKDKGTVLWKSKQNEEFIVGFLSIKPGSGNNLINLMINTPKGINKIFYQFQNGEYTQIDTFKYLDEFKILQSTIKKIPFTLDLEKEKIPEILDRNAILGPNKAALMIPKTQYMANKIVYGKIDVYDGSHIQMHIPIAIAYEIEGVSYLDIVEVKENQNTGHIYSYVFQPEGYSTLIKSSELVTIFDIFTERISPIKTSASNKQIENIKKESQGYEQTKKINFDIKNIDINSFEIEKFKVLNISTIKYTPIGGIITSVSYGTYPIWTSNDEEIRCRNIITHSVSGVIQSIEMTILDIMGRTTSKLIPYKDIINDAQNQNGANTENKKGIKWDENTDKNQHIDPETYVTGELDPYLSTPPNSPTAPHFESQDHDLNDIKSKILKSEFTYDLKSTPPNSPARTPPPSPSASKRSSIAESYEYINDIDQDVKYYKEDIDRLFSDDDNSTITSDSEDYDDEWKSLDDSKMLKVIKPDSDLEDLIINDPQERIKHVNPKKPKLEHVDTIDKKMIDSEHFDAMLQQDFYNEEYGKKYYYNTNEDNITNFEENISLNISSRESIAKLNVIDGRAYVPFIFLTPHINQRIESISEGSQMIWDGTKNDKYIKYISIYLYKNLPKAMYLMIIQNYTTVNKYYLKTNNKWTEISFSEYIKNTPYEIIQETKSEKSQIQVKQKQEKQETEKQEIIKEKELHVSIMIPVILGSLFVIVSVCSLLFILFFC